MISNEGYIDGSWKLKVVSEDLNGVVLLTVYNNTNFEEVARKISQHFNIDKKQMKYFCFWCPSKMAWLTKTDSTLHQLSLNANTMILYMKKIRQINIQVTSKESRKISLDFSLPILNIIKDLCQELGIANYYKFSLMRYRRDDGLNVVKSKSFANKLANSPLTVSLKNLAVSRSNNKRIHKNLGSNCPWTPTSGYGSLSSTMNSLENYHGSYLSVTNHLNHNGVVMELIPEKSAYPTVNNHITEYQSNFDRSKINCEWVFSTKSLMEQKLNEHSSLQLKIKSFTLCFDEETISEELLDLYFEQMKSAILLGEIDAEINIALILGALQYHIVISENLPDKNKTNTLFSLYTNALISLEDEINQMLFDLEKELLIYPDEYDYYQRLPVNAEFFVYMHQIVPMRSIDKIIPMKLKLMKNVVKLFKESNLSRPRYEFDIKTCFFQSNFGMKSNENSIIWTFEQNNRFIKIETKFFTDEDFTSIYALAIVHSNCWQPTFKLYSNCEQTVKDLLNIYRSSDEPEYNIFNMPRVELIELLGCRAGKKELSAKYLKTILRYSCNFKNSTSRQGKIQYLRLCMNIPRYNYHYFYVDILEPIVIAGSTIVAINEEMFMIFDSTSFSVKRRVLPWTMLKSWTINTELNKLELRFEKQIISLTTNNCSAICFHEFISTFIWFAMANKSQDKTERLNELLNLMKVK